MKQLLTLALALFTIGCATTQPTVQALQQAVCTAQLFSNNLQESFVKKLSFFFDRA